MRLVLPLAALALLSPALAAPAQAPIMTPAELEAELAASLGAAKTPCHGCGHGCDAQCNCGVCKMDRCKTESLCMGPCDAGHNAKWCGGGGPTPPTPPAPPPGPPAPPSPPTPSFATALTIQQCTAAGCVPVKKRIALDDKSNHTSSAGTSLIEVGGAAGDKLTLTYGGADVGGPRVYLIEEEKNSNTMFMLKGKEFSFEVELSTMPCGFNAALYFVGMGPNVGGAENGTNYCDAQVT